MRPAPSRALFPKAPVKECNDLAAYAEIVRRERGRIRTVGDRLGHRPDHSIMEIPSVT